MDIEQASGCIFPATIGRLSRVTIPPHEIRRQHLSIGEEVMVTLKENDSRYSFPAEIINSFRLTIPFQYMKALHLKVGHSIFVSVQRTQDFNRAFSEREA